MGFMDWLKLGRNKNKDIKVTKIKEETIGIGEMAAGNQAAANKTLSRMMDQQTATQKVLMVQDGDYMPQITDYALKMAQRLDCDIIALDVSDAPLQFSGERKERETTRFQEKAMENNARFAMQAEAKKINMVHYVEVANPEEAIARLSEKDAGIRYVLTKPERESIRVNEERTQIPVIDLNCSRLTGNRTN